MLVCKRCYKINVCEDERVKMTHLTVRCICIKPVCLSINISADHHIWMDSESVSSKTLRQRLPSPVALNTRTFECNTDHIPAQGHSTITQRLESIGRPSAELYSFVSDFDFEALLAVNLNIEGLSKWLPSSSSSSSSDMNRDLNISAPLNGVWFGR